MESDLFLRSSSDNKSVCITFFTDPHDDFGELVALGRIRILGHHYHEADEDSELLFTADYIPFSVAALRRFSRKVRSWLERPLTKFDPSGLVGEFDFRPSSGEGLALKFGPRDDTISDRKVTLTAKFNAGTTQLEQIMVTDQSCLREFDNGIATMLASFS